MSSREKTMLARILPLLLAMTAVALLPTGDALGQDREGDAPVPDSENDGGDGGADEGGDGGDGEDNGGNDDGDEGQPVAPGPCGAMGSPHIMLFVVLGGFLLLYFWSGRTRRKQEAKRREMLENLKKGDKVTSIGGICGSVVEVREDEVVVKVDETGNTRMRLARWAIRGVGDEAKTESPDQQKK